ncbi:MAG: shikimate kinase [Bacteroidales bacterium]|jgi:shikimate kinase
MMAKNQIIYIIGFMGSGKTTAGKKLASLLGWSFIDLDKKIEEQATKTIPEIFSQNGEDYFRSIEAQLLRKLKSCSNTVISTGGGAPCYSDNMDFMTKTGLTLYLKLTPAELKSRLSKSKGERPLIKNLDQEKLQYFIEEKLADREKWYNRSDITVEGIDLDINLLLSLVKSKLNI